LATAQSILSAAEISLPTGNLVNGVYDTLGNYYQLPEWVVCDPNDLLADDTDDTRDAKGELAGTEDDTGAGEDDEDEADQEAEQRRAEKGKAVVDEREQITVRARLSESGRDYQVVVGKTDLVRTVAKRIAHESGVSVRSRDLRNEMDMLTGLISSRRLRRSVSRTWGRSSRKRHLSRLKGGRPATSSMLSSSTDELYVLLLDIRP
jgi:hypothetical protein